jgi:hypothetical protein
MRGFPWFQDGDGLDYFPLCWEVPFEQDCIDQLGYVLIPAVDSSLWILPVIRSYPGDLLGCILLMTASTSVLLRQLIGGSS